MACKKFFPIYVKTSQLLSETTMFFLQNVLAVRVPMSYHPASNPFYPSIHLSIYPSHPINLAIFMLYVIYLVQTYLPMHPPQIHQRSLPKSPPLCIIQMRSKPLLSTSKAKSSFICSCILREGCGWFFNMEPRKCPGI